MRKLASSIVAACVSVALLPSVASAHGGHRAMRWITPPISAPHRFDLVGVAREPRELEIRVRDDGGEWSEWVEQSDETPIYVDGADEAQVRARFRPRGRLHFVNVSGDGGSALENLVNGARSSINSAFVSVAGSFVADAAPMITARRRRATTGLSRVAITSLKATTPLSVGQPDRSTLTLIVIGTP